MRFLKILIFLTVFPLGAHAASISEADRLIEENNYLKSEHQLAKTPQIYAVFDLAGKRILIKAKGTVLKELPVKSSSIWGAAIQPKPLTLLRKGAIIKPGRPEIKPKKNDEESTSGLDALQIEDMPTRYHLSLDEGIKLYVRPTSAGVISGLFNLFSSLKAYLITRPLGSLWNRLHREAYTEIVLYVQEKDARYLYWSFQEGFQCLIRCG